MYSAEWDSAHCPGHPITIFSKGQRVRYVFSGESPGLVLDTAYVKSIGHI